LLERRRRIFGPTSGRTLDARQRGKRTEDYLHDLENRAVRTGDIHAE